MSVQFPKKENTYCTNTTIFDIFSLNRRIQRLDHGLKSELIWMTMTQELSIDSLYRMKLLNSKVLVEKISHTNNEISSLMKRGTYVRKKKMGMQWNLSRNVTNYQLV